MITDHTQLLLFHLVQMQSNLLMAPMLGRMQQGGISQNTWNYLNETKPYDMDLYSQHS